jgi:hypothetical protein
MTLSKMNSLAFKLMTSMSVACLLTLAGCSEKPVERSVSNTEQFNKIAEQDAKLLNRKGKGVPKGRSMPKSIKTKLGGQGGQSNPETP